ncbi:hypothetical protein AB0J81_30990 [Streptomyces bobili]|uniref:hypothetical protein n=1 Tax=Streptomyces bobili TaxID=67280 RepID=UPI0033D7EB6D
MKGDRVETAVDAGDATRTDEVVAGGAGRRVGMAVGTGVVEVSEVTLVVPTPRLRRARTGRPLREDPET